MTVQARDGQGGQRRDEAAPRMSGTIGVPGLRLMSRLPIAQLSAPDSARQSATGLRSAPTVSPISAKPAKATAMPVHCRALGTSCRNAAESRTVKNTCICCVTDARPGGRPASNAKNSRRNWPANKVRPIITSAPQPIRGRGTKRAGRPAIRNRNAVSCGAEKLSKPNFVATKARPQITAVSAAKNM